MMKGVCLVDFLVEFTTHTKSTNIGECVGMVGKYCNAPKYTLVVFKHN